MQGQLFDFYALGESLSQAADRRYAPHNHTETSKEAADSHATDHLAKLEAAVLAAVQSHGRLTCDMVEFACGLSHQTASARIRGLVLKNRLVDSGEKAVTRSGRRAVLWMVAKGES